LGHDSLPSFGGGTYNARTASNDGGGVDDGLDGAIEQCLASSGCPQCGERLHLLRILSRRTATAVIATHCEGCGAVANRVCFTGDLLARLHHCLADPFDEGLPEGEGAVVAEDVVAMHDYLNGFDGDFLALFRRSWRP
jgi:hypothetical protein